MQSRTGSDGPVYFEPGAFRVSENGGEQYYRELPLSDKRMDAATFFLSSTRVLGTRTRRYSMVGCQAAVSRRMYGCYVSCRDGTLSG